MNYLVTGGAGFIGHHLVGALLNAGHQVVVVDDLSSGKRKNLHETTHFIEGDITDAALWGDVFSAHAIDGVFHLAAIASVQRCAEEWARAHEVNSGGMVMLLDAVKQQQEKTGAAIPLVYASSAAVYGACENVPISENEPSAPISAYGADKRDNEVQASIGWQQFNISSVGLRFFNVYGPNQDASSPYSGVISIFNDRAEQGLPLTIFGDGKQSRDFIYVTDIAEGLCSSMAALEQKKLTCDVMNLASGREVTITQLAQTLNDVHQNSAGINYETARVGDIVRSLGNAENARKSIGFVPRIDLKEGLALLVASGNR